MAAQKNRWHAPGDVDAANLVQTFTRLDLVLNDKVAYVDDALTFSQMVTFTAAVTFAAMVTVNPGPLLVGTLDPGSGAKLRVGAAGAQIAVGDGTVRGVLQGIAADSAFEVGSSTNHSLFFFTNGATRWAITNAGTLYPAQGDNALDFGSTASRVKNVYTKQLQLLDDVTNGNPYINFTWKNGSGTARQGYLEALADTVRFYSGTLGASVLTMDYTIGKITFNAATGSDFYAASHRRSAGNTAFPDLYGDGTNALVLAGKSDGTGLLKFGTLGSALLFTDDSFDIGASGATRPRDIYLTGTVFCQGANPRLVYTNSTNHEFDIEASTADGSDNNDLSLAGGGNDDVGRGAVIKIAGNENTTQGNGVIDYFAGDVAGGEHTWHTAGALERMRLTNDGNLALCGSAAFGTGFGSFGSGTKVIFIANATTDPSTNPAGGGVLYASGGALKWRGSSGTVTTIANA